MSIESLAAEVVTQLAAKKLTIATAESCTGGMLAQYITSVAGASAVFEYGIISYANAVKVRELLVSAQSLQTFGAVSEQVCAQMADGALKNARSSLGVSITGIAGPDGGTTEKPVGTVFICVTDGAKKWLKKLSLAGSRTEIRQAAAECTLKLIKEVIDTIQ